MRKGVERLKAWTKFETVILVLTVVGLLSMCGVYAVRGGTSGQPWRVEVERTEDQPVGMPNSGQKKPDSLLPLMKLYYRKYPKLLETIATRHTHYNATLDEIVRQEAAGELLVIRPPEKLPIGRTENDPQKLRSVYETGRRTAEAKMPEIRAYLSL